MKKNLKFEDLISKIKEGVSLTHEFIINNPEVMNILVKHRMSKRPLGIISQDILDQLQDSNVSANKLTSLLKDTYIQKYGRTKYARKMV